MNDVEANLQAAWQSVTTWYAQLSPDTLALSIDVLMILVILVVLLFGYRRLMLRQRQAEDAATEAQKDIVERLEKVADRLELRLSEAAEKLNREIAAIGEDAREARRLGRSLPAQLERIQAGLSAAQDELLNQSVAKYQANEAIKNALIGNQPKAPRTKQPGKRAD